MRYHSFETVQAHVAFKKAAEVALSPRHNMDTEVAELYQLRELLDKWIGEMERDCAHPLNGGIISPSDGRRRG